MTAPRYRWQPTTAEIAARYGLHPNEVVRFDHNTSPFSTDWAPASVTALARDLNEYPGASYKPLRHAAAVYTGVPDDAVVPGAGIDELIILIAKAFLSGRSRACAAVPTYPLYEIASKQRGAEFVSVEYEAPSFRFPTDALSEVAETADITWLCVPSNPIGTRADRQVVERCVSSAKGLVVIDAAYAEFSGDRWAGFVADHPHVIILHTLSKAFGLAAIRVGYAVGHPDVIDRIDGVRPPGSISTISAALAEEVLVNPQRMHRHVARIVKERDRFADNLAALGLAVVPGSETNFVLCEVGDAAPRVNEALLSRGLVVRSYPPESSLARFLRFTVRSPDENDRLLHELASLRSEAP